MTEDQHGPNTGLYTVEVIYALVDQQKSVTVQVPPRCTVELAIQLSGILTLYPEIDLSQQPVGVFSHKVNLSTVVSAGDRIEIYRPLLQDPKTRRRKKAKGGRE